MSDSSLFNTVVDETANLGKATSSVSFIISIVIGIILLIIAIYFGSQPQKPSVKALIKSSKCESETRMVNDKKEVLYTCLLKVIYTVNNVEYINDMTVSSSSSYNPNTYIDIEYEEYNPNIIILKGVNNSMISSIFMVIAIVIIGASYANYYLSNQSKTYASLQGFSAIGSFFNRKSK
jgi:hypothetical protein